MARGAASLATVLIVVGTIVPAARAEPFLTRNQSPLLALYGLPAPLPSRLPAAGGGRFAAVVNWSNAAATESSDERAFTVDGEVFELRLHLDHATSDRFALHAELPWRHLSAGSLDGVIDEWHDLLGLPDGSRNRLPEKELLIEYRSGTTTLLSVDDSTSGLGDIPLAAGYQLFANERRALATWLTVKLPTGSTDDLTGSGAVDVALTLTGSAQLSDHWQIFGQASLAWLGEGDLLPELQQDHGWTAMAGISWNAWRGLDLTAQLESNSKVFDGTGTDLDGDATVLTFGGSWRTRGGWRFEFGVSEDVEVGASPDVAFNLAVSRNYQ